MKSVNNIMNNIDQREDDGLFLKDEDNTGISTIMKLKEVHPCLRQSGIRVYFLDDTPKIHLHIGVIEGKRKISTSVSITKDQTKQLIEQLTKMVFRLDTDVFFKDDE